MGEPAWSDVDRPRDPRRRANGLYAAGGEGRQSARQCRVRQDRERQGPGEGPEHELVSRFRSSHHCAAHSFANFGIEGTLAVYDSSAVFGFEVPTQTRGYNDRNFKSTALGGGFEGPALVAARWAHADHGSDSGM